MTGVSPIFSVVTAGDVTLRGGRAPVRAADARGTEGTAAYDVRAALRGAAAAVHDAVASAAAPASIAVAVEDLNQVLDTLESENLSPDFRVSIANAVREAVAAVSNGAASGLTLARVDGKEKVVIDTAVLEETLANDPRALDALVAGTEGLPDAFSVVLAEEAEVALAAETDPPAEVDPRQRAADLVRSAIVTKSLQTLQLLDALPAGLRRSLDILV